MSEDHFKNLRLKAEKQVKNQSVDTRELSKKEMTELVHELQVHQIELEMQNEELHTAQKELEASRNRFSELYHQAPAGYVTLDKNGLILEANATFCDMINTDFSQIFQKPFHVYVHPDDRSVFISRFNAFFKRPVDKIMELRLSKSLYVRLEGKINETDKGHRQLFLIVYDIGLEIEQKEKIRFQAQLLSAVKQAVIATDINGQVIYWNNEAENLYGWTAKEAAGKNIMSLTPTNQTLEDAREIMKKLSEGKSWSGEFLVKRKDGLQFPAHVSDSPVFDDDNQLIGIIGISFDISERKQAEQAVKQSRDHLNKVLSSISDGFFTLDSHLF